LLARSTAHASRVTQRRLVVGARPVETGHQRRAARRGGDAADRARLAR